MSICKINRGINQIFLEHATIFNLKGIRRNLAFNHQYLSVRRLLKSRDWPLTTISE